MTAVLFDTHRFVMTLQGKGSFTAAQSEAVAEAATDALAGGLATNTDLRDAESRLVFEMGQIRIAIADTALNTLKWVIGIVGFQTVALIGAAFGFAHFAH